MENKHRSWKVVGNNCKVIEFI